MPILAVENWTTDGKAINAWVSTSRHMELQKYVPECHTGAENTGKQRGIYYEYNIDISDTKMKECLSVNGWTFEKRLKTGIRVNFTLSFTLRKQNPNFPIQSREELHQMFKIQGS
jgi:hypothetical protein